MRNHEYYQEGCAFTEDGVRCNEPPEAPVHLAGVVHSEATELEVVQAEKEIEADR